MRKLGWVTLLAVPLTFLGVFFLWPVTTMISTGFSSAAGVGQPGIWEILGSSRVVRALGQTLAQSAVGTVVAVALGVPGAFVLYRCSFRGQRALRIMVTVPFVLPTVVVALAFRTLLAEDGLLGFLGLDGSFIAIVAALVFFNYSVVVRTVGSLWAGLDPRPEQAAAALGASPWRVFRTVTFPALAPAIAAAGSVVFLFCATAYGVVMVLGGGTHSTVETEIWLQTTQFFNLRTASVLSIVQLLVVAVLLGILEFSRRRTQVHFGASVPAPERRRLTRSSIPAVIVTGTVLSGLILLPLLVLIGRSLQTKEGIGFGNYQRLFEIPDSALAVSGWQALLNSLQAATVATIIGLVMGFAMSVVLSRNPRRRLIRIGLRSLDAAFMLPLGVSAVTVGFGFLITLTAPLHRLGITSWMVPFAQAVIAVPLVVRTLLPALRGISPRQREAAAVLGAKPWRVFQTIDLVALRRPVVVAVGFAFAVSLGEFGATNFLARPESPTLPVFIFRLSARPGANNLGTALAAAVVLGLVTMAVMALVERARTTSPGRMVEL